MDKTNEQTAYYGEHPEDPVDNMDERVAKKKLTSDLNEVQFTSVNFEGYYAKNRNAEFNIFVPPTAVRMRREELMKNANEPSWVRLKRFRNILFWMLIVIFVMILALSSACLIKIGTSKNGKEERIGDFTEQRCPPAPRSDWYKDTAMYQLDVETFKDSNGDGVGDFRGLISKLEYFKTQNIGTLLLNAFYESSDSDAITDHKKIDGKLGTLTDFEELISELNQKDIKLVVDFNPNHSSDQHQWFIDSVEMKETYKDFYVWSDTKNNWLNVESESAWTYNEKRGQYYLSTFGRNRPDLNLRNAKVREELMDILKFWLEKGVHGFKVVAASHLIEDASMRDEPLSVGYTVSNVEYKDMHHIYTVDNLENVGLFGEWREVLTSHTESVGLRKILLAEVCNPSNSCYVGDSRHPLVDLDFNVELTHISYESTAVELKKSIDFEPHLPQYRWPAFLVGSKEYKRLASRVGGDLVDAMYMITFIAKGTPITYYGDELGMEDLGSNEDGMTQSVMLWDNDTNAGFSSCSSTLKIHPDYKIINVKTQEKQRQSHLNIFKRLLALRDQPALCCGLQEYPVLTDETFSMIRVRKGSPGYLVVVNLGARSTVVNFTGTSDYLPDVGRVEVRSKNLISGPLTVGDYPRVALSNVPLGPKQGVVFSFLPQIKE